MTAASNVIVAVVLIIAVLKWPNLVKDINIKVISWLISGVIMISMLRIKIGIFVRIYRRAQLPENYHLNFFGKKVLHPTVVKAYEVILFFVTMPIFLFAGAYFVARLINLILYKHL